MNILFFGSTPDSVIVLKALQQFNNVAMQQLVISAVVTQPPRPVGRKQVFTPTPVEVWAEEHKIPVLSFPNYPDHPYLFADEQRVIDALAPFKADLLISASFGQKIPWPLIKGTPWKGLNVHPSLLPRWRGADPVPWAILSGDHQTGVSIVTLEEKFDSGKILAQKKIPITEKDFSDPLRTKLFTLGAGLLVKILPDYISGKLKGSSQQSPLLKPHKYKRPLAFVRPGYARRLTRDDGFIPWELLDAAMKGEKVSSSTIQQFNNVTMVKEYLKRANNQLNNTSWSTAVFRAFRAFSPWPGLWTRTNPINPTRFAKATARRANLTNPTNELKRLKILSCHLSSNNLILDSVQLEGKKPVVFSEFSRSYLPKNDLV